MEVLEYALVLTVEISLWQTTTFFSVVKSHFDKKNLKFWLLKSNGIFFYVYGFHSYIQVGHVIKFQSSI